MNIDDFTAFVKKHLKGQQLTKEQAGNLHLIIQQVTEPQRALSAQDVGNELDGLATTLQDYACALRNPPGCGRSQFPDDRYDRCVE